MSIASVADSDMPFIENFVPLLSTDKFEKAVECGYDSAAADEFREFLRVSCPAPSAEEAEKLLEWVDSLHRSLLTIVNNR